MSNIGTNLNYLYLKPVGVSGQTLGVMSGAATSFFLTTLPNTKTEVVLVDVQTADCFVTFGGETPSTTVGHRLYAGQNYTWSVAAALQAKIIANSTAATLYASEFTA